MSTPASSPTGARVQLALAAVGVAALLHAAASLFCLAARGSRPVPPAQGDADEASLAAAATASAAARPPLPKMAVVDRAAAAAATAEAEAEAGGVPTPPVSPTAAVEDAY
eukprot:Rhum_TRINITY_DN7174_c0_g1::Rhum_TRINITY_DN7174_c0_g1_i1::g.21742::m.21742